MPITQTSEWEDKARQYGLHKFGDSWFFYVFLLAEMTADDELAGSTILSRLGCSAEEREAALNRQIVKLHQWLSLPQNAALKFRVYRELMKHEKEPTNRLREKLVRLLNGEIL